MVKRLHAFLTQGLHLGSQLKHLTFQQSSSVRLHWLTNVCEGDNIVVRLDNELSLETRYGCISAAWIKGDLWSMYNFTCQVLRFNVIHLNFTFNILAFSDDRIVVSDTRYHMFSFESLQSRPTLWPPFGQLQSHTCRLHREQALWLTLADSKTHI